MKVTTVVTTKLAMGVTTVVSTAVILAVTARMEIIMAVSMYVTTAGSMKVTMTVSMVVTIISFNQQLCCKSKIEQLTRNRKLYNRFFREINTDSKVAITD